MTLLYIICVVLAVGCVVLLVVVLGAKGREAKLDARCQAAETTMSDNENRRREAELSFAAELSSKNERITELSSEFARSQSRIEALTGQIARDKDELEKLQASFRLEFRNMANEILEEKSTQFKRTNKEAMDVLLKPFKDNISQFRERVELIYSDENRQRGALQNEIKNLLELNHKITAETTNLTNALKGNSKVQGDWGEMILQTILESSNLIHGIHYTTQENLKDEQGNNLRPDVILNLPTNKKIIIDSKVSLTAFVNYTAEEDAALRDKLLREHLQSVRKHVDELGSKRYQELIDSPDFVIMFVPNEPAFMVALQNDSSIWNDAYKKKVIVSSPTNLFALLKIVDDLWKRDDQSRNALQIADEGAKLYDKVVGFVETLESLGKGIGSVSASYEKAMNQLQTGSGNIIGRTEKLRILGVKGSKSLPAKMVLASHDEQEIGQLTETIEGGLIVKIGDKSVVNNINSQNST